MQFGERIKELRESKELLQRQLAASLEIDTPMFSKIERGERRAKREQVLLLAELLEADANELLTICLLYTSPSPRDLSTSRMPSSA